MTTWLLSFGWNWLLIPVVAWFLNGLRKALLNPRIKLHSTMKAGDGYLVDVTRQELVPPWRQSRETWLVSPYRNESYQRRCLATREGDGQQEDSDYSKLARALAGVLRVAQAREAETEDLAK